MKISPYTQKQLIAVIMVLLGSFFTGETEAQIRVNMQMSKRAYVLNEPVKATLQITNQTGGELILENTSNKPWVTFNATSEGNTLAKVAIVNYPKLIIPIGQTVATECIISDSYALGGQGAYACEAVVHLPGVSSSSVSSNRCPFVISNGRIA